MGGEGPAIAMPLSRAPVIMPPPPMLRMAIGAHRSHPLGSLAIVVPSQQSLIHATFPPIIKIRTIRARGRDWVCLSPLRAALSRANTGRCAMRVNGSVVSGGGAKDLSVALVCSFLANAKGGVTLDTGKVIPQIRKGWRATESEKAEAAAIYGKLKSAEKTEISEGFKPEIEKFLASRKLKNRLFSEYTASRGSRNLYS